MSDNTNGNAEIEDALLEQETLSSLLEFQKISEETLKRQVRNQTLIFKEGLKKSASQIRGLSFGYRRCPRLRKDGTICAELLVGKNVVAWTDPETDKTVDVCKKCFTALRNRPSVKQIKSHDHNRKETAQEEQALQRQNIIIEKRNVNNIKRLAVDLSKDVEMTEASAIPKPPPPPGPPASEIPASISFQKRIEEAVAQMKALKEENDKLKAQMEGLDIDSFSDSQKSPADSAPEKPV
jgi:hypothetical protein